ncbi:MAG: glycosyltransferase [Rhodothermales bacterium]|nr:glycosyltransferase [Rhodothermales bacterium]MBO6780185.1 glycosyltransferase [Rhodothermales bacterium]
MQTPSQRPETSARLTVVMHTYERPTFLQRDIRAGRWQGVPLLISDDASSAAVQEQLRDLTAHPGVSMVARPENGGPAQAAAFGVSRLDSPLFALCGDDDYLMGFPEFAREASTLLEDPGVLMVAMPQLHLVVDEVVQGVQYDRQSLDGMTGQQLLRELVFGGEMKALQAGTALRRHDALPHFASSLFRTSEDFVLICRMCASNPGGVIRTARRGGYYRRKHAASLSHGSNMDSGRLVVNLVAQLVGARLLQQVEDLDEPTVLGLLRQRAQVLQTAYGGGLEAMGVLESLLSGHQPDPTSQEGREAFDFLLTNQDRLPLEAATLRQRLAGVRTSTLSTTDAVQAANSLLQAGDVQGAAAALRKTSEQDVADPAAYYAIQAQIAWSCEAYGSAVKSLCRGLVHNPTHAECLHLLAQVALAVGEEAAADRLRNRLIASIGPEEARRSGLEPSPNVDDLRVAFIVSEGLDQFLTDVIRELVPHVDARKFVVSKPSEIQAAADWADVCWFEWCNDPLVWASRQDLLRNKATICRLHRYETFTEMPMQVHWENVDALTVVAEHLIDLLQARIPGLEKRTLIRHIPNGVDLERFAFKEREAGFEIALIGYLHGRKNPQMALEIMRKLVDRDSRYRLHVAGKFQDPALKLFWNHKIERLGLTDHVVMHGWISDVAGFLEDKQYVLSASLHESFGYTIAEGMAQGIKPVVHHFPFAAQMWPEEVLFDTVDDAVSMITESRYDSTAYRQFVQDQYSLDSQIRQIRALIEAVRPDREVMELAMTAIDRVSPRLINAQVDGRCPGCRANLSFQQQTIAGQPVGRMRCNACATTVHVPADTYLQALSRYERSARLSPKDATAEIRNLSRNWHRHPLWEELLSVGGVNLAECMEWEIVPEFTQAFLNASEVQS